jgi:hypothetical protein
MSEQISEQQSKATWTTPYGSGAGDLGFRAVDALYDLCDVPAWSEERRGWKQSDRFALDGWHNVEGGVVSALGDPEITAEQVEGLTELLFEYNVALPFDEAERHWLFDVYNETSGRGSIGVVRRQEGRIVTAGLRRVVCGRELMQRWWSWRRDTDQFAGQGSVDLAREALRVIVETTCPGMELPETYLALRGASSEQRA